MTVYGSDFDSLNFRTTQSTFKGKQRPMFNSQRRITSKIVTEFSWNPTHDHRTRLAKYIAPEDNLLTVNFMALWCWPQACHSMWRQSWSPLCFQKWLQPWAVHPNSNYRGPKEFDVCKFSPCCFSKRPRLKPSSPSTNFQADGNESILNIREQTRIPSVQPSKKSREYCWSCWPFVWQAKSLGFGKSQFEKTILTQVVVEKL